MWRRTLGLAVAAIAAPSVAHAEDGLRGFLPEGSYYVRAEAGSTLESSIEFETRGAVSSEVDFNTPEGWTSGFAVGWAAPNSGLRLEALVEYGETDEDLTAVVSSVVVPYTQSYRLGGAWLMAHYDFLHNERFQPSFGLGLGAVWWDTEIDATPVALPGGGTATVSGDWDPDLTLGLRAALGLSYVLSDRWVADLGYRYVFAPDLEHSTVAAGGAVTIGEADVQSHAVTAGLRYTLGRVDR